MKYRAAFDLGTNSIGWCVYELENEKPVSIKDSGVRIFSDSRDPQSKASLAAERREARSARRNRDRYLQRRKHLMNTLVLMGLMPKDEKDRKELEKLNPYELRVRALDEKIDAFHLGRAIFHINQRRGFKSNRKSDKGADTGAMKTSISDFKNEMLATGARTAGEQLYFLNKEGKSCRARLRGTGAQKYYDIYVDRGLAEQEFDLIWENQSKYNSEILTERAYKEIRHAVFNQRQLRPVKPGKCSCEPKEDRAAKALPVSQLFRIWQTISDLRIRDIDFASRALTDDEKQKLLTKLLTTGGVSFDSIRKLLKLDSTFKFSHENEKNKKLMGDQTAAVLNKYFNKKWAQIPFDKQTEIVKMLLNEEDEQKAVDFLMTNHGLSAEEAEGAANANLIDGYMSFCEPVLQKLVTSMSKGASLTEALQENGYDNRNPSLDGSYDKLPYYAFLPGVAVHIGTGKGEGENEEEFYGKIANPTVHRGLRQLERIVNALIDKYGKPEEIVLEMGREMKKGAEERKKIQKKQAENQNINERLEKELAGLGERNTRENRDRLRLWEELDKNPMSRCCVYCGEAMSKESVCSAEVEIEHILPFSKTLDNSLANKTVSHRRCNRDKTNKSPYEAFGKTNKWTGIIDRAARLPKNKQWRFQADAMTLKEHESGFLDRQLQDNQYFAKVVRLYLTAVCKDVWAVSGKLTSLVRRWSGLNGILAVEPDKKNRQDHRHHAVDAVAIGLIDRAMVKNVADRAANNEIDAEGRINATKITIEPWDGFYEDAKDSIDSIVVSHKQEHGKVDSFHDETAYGIMENEEGEKLLVTRKLLESLSGKQYENIVDVSIRKRIEAELYGLSTEKEKAEAIANLSKKTGIKRVRVFKRQANFIGVKDKNGKVYKHYVKGDYHHVDIYQKEDGSVHGEAASFYDVRDDRFAMPEWKKIKPKPKLLLRLHKKDMLKIEEEGVVKYYTVMKLQPSGDAVYLVEANVAGKVDELIRVTKQAVFMKYKKLINLKAEKVKVNEIGEVKVLKY